MQAVPHAAKRRVLVAAAGPGHARLPAILEGCDVVGASTLDDLRQALAGARFDLVLIGARFDESNWLEALREACAHAGAPVVCMRVEPFPSHLGDSTVHAFRVACTEVGAVEVLDLVEYPDDAAGNARVRAMLERLLEP